MIAQKLESQREIIRKINKNTRKNYQLFDKLHQLRPSVPKVPKGDNHVKKQ